MSSFWYKDIIDMETPTWYKFEGSELINMGKDVVFKKGGDLDKENWFPLFDPPKYYGNVYTSILMEGMIYKHFLKDEYEKYI